MAQSRLDKYLADAGIGTRSQIKSYIKKGQVSVNNEIVHKPDIKISLGEDTVTYNGTPICLTSYEYYILNKPAGYVSATKDNTAPTVLELIDSQRKDLFPVGRLDKDTEGLLIISNDGALSHRLLSPKHHVEKTYFAKVNGIVTSEDILLFENGLYIGDEDLDTALPAKLTIKDINIEENSCSILLTITEGKFHQVKRMVHAVGKEVTYLKRVSFGTLTLPDTLELGQARPLTEEELSSLLTL